MNRTSKREGEMIEFWQGPGLVAKLRSKQEHEGLRLKWRMGRIGSAKLVLKCQAIMESELPTHDELRKARE